MKKEELKKIKKNMEEDIEVYEDMLQSPEFQYTDAQIRFTRAKNYAIKVLNAVNQLLSQQEKETNPGQSKEIVKIINTIRSEIEKVEELTSKFDSDSAITFQRVLEALNYLKYICQRNKTETNPGRVKEYNSWVEVMQKLPEKDRQQWVKIIHSGIRDQASRENKETAKAILNIADNLKDKKEFNLVGFIPNLQYIKDKKTENTPGTLESVYIHAFGTPKLLYQHIKFPIAVIIGPDLRINMSVLDEGTNRFKNKADQIVGITG